jgi:hypothetical protein
LERLSIVYHGGAMQGETRRLVTGLCLMTALGTGCSTTRISNCDFGGRVPHRETSAAVSRDEAMAIANGFFGRQSTAGCYVEELGDHWFVAPPYVKEAASRRAGVYVSKRTGEMQAPERLDRKSGDRP